MKNKHRRSEEKDERKDLTSGGDVELGKQSRDDAKGQRAVKHREVTHPENMLRALWCGEVINKVIQRRLECFVAFPGSGKTVFPDDDLGILNVAFHIIGVDAVWNPENEKNPQD